MTDARAAASRGGVAASAATVGPRGPRAWLPVLFLALSGCAAPPVPVPSVEAARIRATCPAGTFIGTMTVTCPQIAR